ncbi:MAG: hypothetical protein KatS3mg003_1922 [Candidatus Nitrosocaldaceae archaeon]|nr:MAG: hypothetical protein KatS3mg003_1922 [Candidatus Nitrosocaldaceae archaeon]
MSKEWLKTIIRFNREKAKEANRSVGFPFWNPSGEAEALIEVLDEPRTLARTGKMKKDAWLLDVNIIYGRDKVENEEGNEEEIVMENEVRSLVLNAKTVIESKFKALIDKYKELKGKRLAIVGLGETEGENSTYIDFYIDTEENARKEGVIS